VKPSPETAIRDKLGRPAALLARPKTIRHPDEEPENRRSRPLPSCACNSSGPPCWSSTRSDTNAGNEAQPQDALPRFPTRSCSPIEHHENQAAVFALPSPDPMARRRNQPPSPSRHSSLTSIDRPARKSYTSFPVSSSHGMTTAASQPSALPSAITVRAISARLPSLSFHLPFPPPPPPFPPPPSFPSVSPSGALHESGPPFNRSLVLLRRADVLMSAPHSIIGSAIVSANHRPSYAPAATASHAPGFQPFASPYSSIPAYNEEKVLYPLRTNPVGACLNSDYTNRTSSSVDDGSTEPHFEIARESLRSDIAAGRRAGPHQPTRKSKRPLLTFFFSRSKN